MTPLPAGLGDVSVRALAAIGPVVAVRDLAGGRGRTFAVDHGADGSVSATTVVHVRSGGGAAIRREAEATSSAHTVGVGPRVLAVLPDDGVLLTRWLPGDALTADDLADEVTARAVGRAIARLHGTGPAGAQRLDPLATRLTYLRRAGQEGQDDARASAAAAALAADPAPGVLCHGDLVPANLIAGLLPGPFSGTDGIAIVDYEYAGVAEAAFDLGGLAATAELADGPLAALVAGYLEQAGGRRGAELRVDLDRVRTWREVTRHSWLVWVELGEDLGPERDRWVAWAHRARAALEGG